MLIQCEADIDRCLTLAMDIGERMMRVGAEVNRVENVIRRMCRAFGAVRVEAFTITSSIVVTVQCKYGVRTQTRRIRDSHYDLHRLEELNSLARSISLEPYTLEEIERRLERIDRTPTYPFWMMLLFYAMISASFSLFFGGTAMDAVVSGIIGIIIKFLEWTLKKANLSNLLCTFLYSFFGGLAANAFVSLGFGNSPDLISIGNIMLLIPGIAITVSVREMFGGDMISGCLRFIESLLIAVVIAVAFVLASLLF